MDTVNAGPSIQKQANLTMIRGILRSRDTVTRAELAEETGISSTTVRALLAEMMEDREIESAGFDASSGGRKAERYRYRSGRYHCAVLCMSDWALHALVVDGRGEVVEVRVLVTTDGDREGAITAFLDDVTARWEIRAIGLGVPGVVEGLHYWKKEDCAGELRRIDIGETLARRYGLPVVLENDLKATMIGFGQCYEKQFPCESRENTNMAYLQFEEGCVCASFIAGGRIVRGSGQFAGELGLIPMEGDKLLDDFMAEPVDDAQYTQRVAHILGWICGILNPQYIALGGPGLRPGCIGPIGDTLSALLPGRMAAELLHASDMWHDYHCGMACLTAEKMFDTVQFVKE